MIGPIGLPVDRHKTPPLTHLEWNGYTKSPDRAEAPDQDYLPSSPLHVAPNNLNRYAKAFKYFNDFFDSHPEFKEEGAKFLTLTHAMQKDLVSGAEAIDSLTQKARKQREAAAINREGAHQKNWRLKSKGGWLQSGAGKSHFQGKDIAELQIQQVKKLKADKEEQKMVLQREKEEEQEQAEIAMMFGLESFPDADCMPHSDLQYLNEPGIDEAEFDRRFEELQGLYDDRMKDKVRAREQEARRMREKQRIWDIQGRDTEGNLQWFTPIKESQDDLPALPRDQDEDDSQFPTATTSEIGRHEEEVAGRPTEPDFGEPKWRSSSPAFEPPSDNLASLNIDY